MADQKIYKVLKIIITSSIVHPTADAKIHFKHKTHLYAVRNKQNQWSLFLTTRPHPKKYNIAKESYCIRENLTQFEAKKEIKDICKNKNKAKLEKELADTMRLLECITITKITKSKDYKKIFKLIKNI